jgi:hypothetical protein
MNTTRAQVGYLKWLAIEHPAIYRRVATNAATDITMLRGLGSLGWINFLIQAIATAGSAVMGKKAVDKQVALQKKSLALSDAQAAADRDQAFKMKLLEVNTTRAQSGLPPVDASGKVINIDALPAPPSLARFANAITVTGTPGAAGTTVVRAASTLIPGVPNLVTYGGGALLGVGLLRMLKVI